MPRPIPHWKLPAFTFVLVFIEVFLSLGEKQSMFHSIRVWHVVSLNWRKVLQQSGNQHPECLTRGGRRNTSKRELLSEWIVAGTKR